MFKAEVGDDVYKQVTVIELEAVAAMFGMEAGCFPSGTMANKQP
jgi:threonine aldolase